MKNKRNVLIFVGFFLFVLWYGGTWAYRDLYKKPRQKIQTGIKEATEQKNQNELYLQNQQQTLKRLQAGYYLNRSLPQPTQAGQTLYHTWLLELIAYCEFEQNAVTRGNQQRGNAYLSFPFSVRARCSLDQLSRFLYEFYWYPYLHKIVALQVRPVEQTELVDVSIQIEAIYVPPFQTNTQPPLLNRLPEGIWRRLSSGTLPTYTEPIESRNLLQFSRGGIDDSDFARVTAISYVDGDPEVWITLRTSDKKLAVRKGDRFRVGSFFATLVDVEETDVIFETSERNGQLPLRWIVGVGEYLKDATAIPPEY